ncbi:alpha-L-fucosidase [Cohnella nanjingensis]|uniref:alpha-L-fucosidase n=1 Tax=Cohnella nanjingensis TaxID=1387779 RepID=A0A7X0VFT4_9BACL|nr:alpha-L-fucosidase [Cohnella nanjingensis]MBB6672146.1 alpha-L-fucosidase [Cohnella nanjingensis]
MNEYRGALPSAAQLRWQELEMGMFCHFGMNTFCDQEWGEGQDAPERFHPASLDARQWVRAAKQAGMKYFILTAKHHDGFCLWPTATTDYSVASSPWKDGQGDVVRECADACREEGLGFGLYLSPWDRHEPKYADKAAYDDFYAEQLTELLTGYGPLMEVWFDGAGSEGREYDWERIMAIVRAYQPEAMVFNMGAPTIRWVGNEDGVAPYPCWNTAEAARLSMFTDASAGWLDGTPKWVPAECDVPIRAHQWFWHPDAEDRLHTLAHLVDVYYRSVGHGCNLLLNVAPDDRGLLPEADVRRVLELGAEVRRRFGDPAGQTRGAGSELTLELGTATTIDHLVLMEDIRLGERIRSYVAEARQGGAWMELARGSAIGRKKIDAFPPVKADAVRLRVLASEGEPVIRSLRVYDAGTGPVTEAQRARTG